MGNTAHQEASRRTQTYDLVQTVRMRRFQWFGHSLRLKGTRLIQLAIKVQFDKGFRGNMLLDAPEVETFVELVALAAKSDEWKDMRNRIE